MSKRPNVTESAYKIRPYYVVGFTVELALRLLAGYGVMISFAMIHRPENPGGRITIEHLRKFAAAGCRIMFDNGAFSQWKKGTPTDGPAFYAFLRVLDAESIPWEWAFALDVIGNGIATRDQWRLALSEYPDLVPRLMPVFHEGDSWDILEEYDPENRRVVLGRTDGRGSKRKTFEFYDEAFNRYPNMRPHAAGNGTPETLEPYWFSTLDVGTWERGAAFSNANGFPFNRCLKETRMRAYIEATETIEHRPSKQLNLCLIQEEKEE